MSHDDNPEVARARGRVQLFATLLIGAFLVMTTPLPFRLSGIVFTAGAIWVGALAIVSLRRVRRSGGDGRGVPALAVGVGLAIVLEYYLLSQAFFYPMVADLETCMDGAQTTVAQDACTQEFRSRYEQLLTRIENFGTPRA